MTTVQVWRGESSGVLFGEFDLRHTNAGVGFSFAESREHAVCYAGAGTEPRAFSLGVDRVLDLRDVGRAWRNPESRTVIEALRAEFDGNHWSRFYNLCLAPVTCRPRCDMILLPPGESHERFSSR